MEKDLIIGLVIFQLMLILVDGSHLQKVLQVLKVGLICYTQVVQVLLALVNTSWAVLSGLVRLRAVLSCIAGTGLAGRIGIAAAAIKYRLSKG